MNYKQLGRTGLKISPLCLGTMNFGPYTNEKNSYKIMNKALNSGINFFDTANSYGGRLGEGLTEKIIGRWFSDNPSRRQNIVLATKVWATMGKGPNDGLLSARHIKHACHESLRRLKTDYIDLYQLHHIDRNTPFEEIFQALEILVTEGKILYAGTSNFAGWHITKFNEIAFRRNFLGTISEQCLYNLTSRFVEMELLPACRHYGVAVIPYSPLAEGLLGGIKKITSQKRRLENHIQRKYKKLKTQINRYEKLCDKLGEHPSSIALAWLNHQRGVTSLIIGPRTLGQFDLALNSLDLVLNDEILNELENIWPSPGGPAPEAYSW